MGSSRKVLCAIDVGWHDDAAIQAPEQAAAHPLIGPPAEAALRAASREAAFVGAEMVVLHALPMDPGAPMFPDAAEALLLQRQQLASVITDAILEAIERVTGRAPDDVPILVEDGSPARAILTAGRCLGAELIVVGNIGAKGLGDALLGGVAHAVVREAPCSVLVVRSPR